MFLGELDNATADQVHDVFDQDGGFCAQPVGIVQFMLRHDAGL